MIDIHVHSRDAEQADKETVEHCISVAYEVGLDGIVSMPNTNPTLTREKTISAEFRRQDEAIEELGLGGKFWAGVWVGITPDADQIDEIGELYRKRRESDKRILGPKLYMGKSTGNLGIVKSEEQEFVWYKIEENGFEYVPVHCEEEELMRPNLWNYKIPSTHNFARPREAEIKSIEKTIYLARKVGFKGVLHICHVSVPESVELLKIEREKKDLRLSWGVTPHHCVLDSSMMKGIRGLYRKVNPPLRNPVDAKKMLEYLVNGDIPIAESDHAPHTTEQKLDHNLPKPHASGLPVLPYWPVFISLLRRQMSWEQIHAVTHDNVVRTFDINICNSKRIERLVDEGFKDLSWKYPYNPFGVI